MRSRPCYISVLFGAWFLLILVGSADCALMRRFIVQRLEKGQRTSLPPVATTMQTLKTTGVYRRTRRDLGMLLPDGRPNNLVVLDGVDDDDMTRSVMEEADVATSEANGGRRGEPIWRQADKRSNVESQRWTRLQATSKKPDKRPSSNRDITGNGSNGLLSIITDTDGRRFPLASRYSRVSL